MARYNAVIIATRDNVPGYSWSSGAFFGAALVSWMGFSLIGVVPSGVDNWRYDFSAMLIDVELDVFVLINNEDDLSV